MKILFVLNNFFFEKKGGAELQAYYLAKELIQRGHEVYYLREYRKKIALEETSVEGIKLLKVFSVKGLRRNYSIKNFIRTPFIKRAMKEVKPDIVYSRSDDTYMPIISDLKSKFKFKLIWACSLDDKTSLDYWVNNYGKRLAGKILKCIRNADLVVLQTQFQKDQIKENLNIEGIVQYNAHPVPEGITYQKEDLIIWVGRLIERKRPEIFLELAKTLSNTNISFVMIGGIQDYNAQKIYKYHESLKGFTYAGELENDEVSALLIRSKALVNTSTSEGFSNTFIEAWKYGTPVISTGVDPDNLIQNHKLGFKPNNSVKPIIEFLEEKVLAVCTDEELSKQLYKSCRTFSETQLNIKNAVGIFSL